jgi:alcohol/geraniol dehydrogenase (NADP+)
MFGSPTFFRRHRGKLRRQPLQNNATERIFPVPGQNDTLRISPVAIEEMLEFAARHKITPQTEHMPMRRINEAFERLEAGKARYRIVLDADF